MPTLSPRFLATSTVLLVLACSGPSAPTSFASGNAASSAPDGAASSAPGVETVSSVLALTNAERRRAGVAELRESSRLRQAAQIQSDQMGAMSRMDHVLPGAPYPNPVDRLSAVQYAWSAYGENVAMGQSSSNAVIEAWMNSAGHRANILNPRYTELGVGYALDERGRPYYAQVFGRPAN